MGTSNLFSATAPPSGHLPAVTVGMLLDFLADYDVVAQPRNARRTFRWFNASLHGAARKPAGLRSGQVLSICRIGEAGAILKADESTFACALSPDGAVPGDLKAFCERLVVVRQKDTFSYFLFLVQRFFADVMMWEDALDRIVLGKGSLHDLLNVGNPSINDFIVCLDTSGSVLAYTKNAVPPDRAYRDTIALGCEPRSSAAPARRTLTRGVALIEATDEHPLPRLQHDVFFEGTRFASLVLASSRDTISQGIQDLFASLVARATLICSELWREQVRIDSPHHFFLTQLIEGDVPNDAYVEAHLATTAIPSPAQLKLITLDVREAERAAPFAAVVEAVRGINNGDCHCFVHRGRLCALCYAPEGDNQLSHKRAYDDAERLVFGPFGVTGTSSQIFEDIRDLDLAFRQATIAANLRPLVQRESENGSVRALALIPFENCLLYYLVGCTDKDERFLTFCLSHTLMQKISAEDAEHGTDYLEIFWQYLACERNATAVAERLHLHRNTVLYRIDKIQKRFDLDLSAQDVREKMLVDFKVFFLMQNHTSLKAIFGDEE